MTTRLDLPPIRLGDDYTVTLRFWADRAKTTRLDLSDNNYAASFRALRSTDDLVDFTVDDTNSATGLLVLRVGHVESADLATGLCEWDLEETAPGDVITTLFAGRVPVQRDVTP